MCWGWSCCFLPSLLACTHKASCCTLNCRSSCTLSLLPCSCVHVRTRIHMLALLSCPSLSFSSCQSAFIACQSHSATSPCGSPPSPGVHALPSALHAICLSVEWNPPSSWPAFRPPFEVCNTHVWGLDPMPAVQLSVVLMAYARMPQVPKAVTSALSRTVGRLLSGRPAQHRPPTLPHGPVTPAAPQQVRVTLCARMGLQSCVCGCGEEEGAGWVCLTHCLGVCVWMHSCCSSLCIIGRGVTGQMGG